MKKKHNWMEWFNFKSKKVHVNHKVFTSSKSERVQASLRVNRKRAK